MDNLTLNKEQLYQLISFINKRGFHEPLMIVEILDHFACKVEEKMNQISGISLDAAMTAAHDDFCPLGFVPIAKAYEANIKKKYKAVYRAQFKSNLSNPFYIITALLISLLFYKGCYWAEINNYKHVLDFNDAVLGITIGYFVSLLFLSFRYQPTVRKNPISKVILSMDTPWIGIFLGFNPIRDFKYHTPEFSVFAILYAIGCFYLVMRHFAVYTTLKKGHKDSAIVYDYLKSVNVAG